MTPQVSMGGTADWAALRQSYAWSQVWSVLKITDNWASNTQFFLWSSISWTSARKNDADRRSIRVVTLSSRQAVVPLLICFRRSTQGHPEQLLVYLWARNSQRWYKCRRLMSLVPQVSASEWSSSTQQTSCRFQQVLLQWRRGRLANRLLCEAGFWYARSNLQFFSEIFSEAQGTILFACCMLIVWVHPSQRLRYNDTKGIACTIFWST